jgi:hypothetical protein
LGCLPNGVGRNFKALPSPAAPGRELQEESGSRSDIEECTALRAETLEAIERRGEEGLHGHLVEVVVHVAKPAASAAEVVLTVKIAGITGRRVDEPKIAPRTAKDRKPILRKRESRLRRFAEGTRRQHVPGRHTENG